MKGGLLLVVLLMQLGAAYLNLLIERQLITLEFGSMMVLSTLGAIFLGVASGIVLGVLLFPVFSPVDDRSWLIVLSIVPLLTVLFKLVFAWVGPQFLPFSLLRPGSMAFIEWALASQVPSLWLGLVLGRLLPLSVER